MILFNCSMPRSGSTLMQNILGQNPDIHTTPTDGFLELIYGARVNYTSNAEFKAQDPEQMKRAWQGFCREGMKGYAAGLSNKKHTCIKSRGIGEQYNWLKSFMGEDPKVICMVRDAKAILASMEKIHRKGSDTAQSVMNPLEMRGLTVGSRVQSWLQGPPVGLALQRFQGMAELGTAKNCLILRFEDLTAHPKEAMQKVYEYLELPEYEHDFNNVEQLTVEDDAVYGLTPDLHAVKKKVEPIKPDYEEVLGADLCKSIDDMCAGYQRSFNYT